MATHEGEVDDDRLSTVSKDNQSYQALVWRKFKRSIPGMIGLTMVCMLLFTAVFAEFMDPAPPAAGPRRYCR